MHGAAIARAPPDELQAGPRQEAEDCHDVRRRAPVEQQLFDRHPDDDPSDDHADTGDDVEKRRSRLTAEACAEVGAGGRHGGDDQGSGQLPNSGRPRTLAASRTGR